MLDIRLAEGCQVLRLTEGHQVLAGRRTPDIGLAEDVRKVSAGRRSLDIRLAEGRQVMRLAGGHQVLSG
jgi:hypothetical protein